VEVIDSHRQSSFVVLWLYYKTYHKGDATIWSITLESSITFLEASFTFIILTEKTSTIMIAYDHHLRS
jgi:hypothetical protein